MFQSVFFRAPISLVTNYHDMNGKIDWGTNCKNIAKHILDLNVTDAYDALFSVNLIVDS